MRSEPEIAGQRRVRLIVLVRLVERVFLGEEMVAGSARHHPVILLPASEAHGATSP
jgi:hypothetical protein